MAAANDPCERTVDDDYIKVAVREGEEFVEIPKELDCSITLSTVQTQFPDAIGLKYRASSGAWRAIRAVENVLAAPKRGWGDDIYYVTEPEIKKRKSNSNGGEERDSKVARPSSLLQDLAVMGLPFKTTIEELREYFETKYGELVFSEIKHDRKTGKSRGYGFIRFKDESAAKDACDTEHFFDGRMVEVRQKKDRNFKLFVGRLPNGTTLEELDKYFSQFGEVKDTYIPTPFANYAFVTYATTEDGHACLREVHELNGSRLNVMQRNPDTKRHPDKHSSDRWYNGSKSSSQGNGSTQHASRGKDGMEAALKTMLFEFLAKN